MIINQSLLISLDYSGCQKNVWLSDRFFLQPLIPTFGISELILEKRYIGLSKKRLVKSFFSTTTYTNLWYFGTYFRKAVYRVVKKTFG
jgi:hypothetical protein